MIEFFEHKADVGIRGIGKTKEEAIKEVCRGVFKLMFNIPDEYSNFNLKTKEIEVSGNNDVELMINFINECLYLFDVENTVFFDFLDVEIKENGEKKLSAKGLYDFFDENKFDVGTEVKAATFCEAKVYKKGDFWIAQCVVDV